MKNPRAVGSGAGVVKSVRVGFEFDGVVGSLGQLFGQVAVSFRVEEMHCGFVLSTNTHAVGNEGSVVRCGHERDAGGMIGAEALGVEEYFVGAVDALAATDDKEVLVRRALGKEIVAAAFERVGEGINFLEFAEALGDLLASR